MVYFSATGCSIDQDTVIRRRYTLVQPWQSHYPTDSNVTVTCPFTLNSGKFATGESTIELTCGEDGEWKGTLPLCVDFGI